MKTAFIFPGQGSQTVGMGKDLYDAFPLAREVFEQVDDALGQKLSKIIFEGPAEELNLTENTQPALMAVSMAVMAVLEDAAVTDITSLADAVAGHSLGEYSAHAAVRTFTIKDTAILLKTRGQAMQQAVPVGVGAMAAILGLEMADIKRICKASSLDGHIVVSANDNSPGQIVISGHKKAVDDAIQMATEAGAKRAILLPVSAPFHCPLMQPAADVMARALKVVDSKDPILPVYANVTTGPVTDDETAKRLLVEQITAPVRWRETVLRMGSDGFERMIEVGAGKVLTGLNKRINPSIETLSVGTPKEIEELIRTLPNFQD